MPPKKSSAAGSKAKAKGAPKAAAKPAGPTPEELMAKEAEENFERYAEEGGGVKLKGLAECIRTKNIAKNYIWADGGNGTGPDIGPNVIKKTWDTLGKKEITKEAFLEWWPTFIAQVEARKAEVEAEAEQKEAAKAEEAKAKADLYDNPGVWNVPLADLQTALDEAWKRDKTPLIIDNTEGLLSETFFTYSGAHILECKKLIVDKAKGSPVEKLLEDVRDAFFRAKCLKQGQTIVFRLANTAADMKNTFNSPVFPTLDMLNVKKVKECMGPDNADKAKGSPFDIMCPNDDERGEVTLMGIHEKFRAVVITHFQEEDYEGFLKDMFPLDLCHPIKPFVK